MLQFEKATTKIAGWSLPGCVYIFFPRTDLHKIGPSEFIPSEFKNNTEVTKKELTLIELRPFS